MDDSSPVVRTAAPNGDDPLLWARLYPELGLSIIPLSSPKFDGHRSDGKRPALESWKPYHSRHATDDEIEQWWGRPSDKGIAIVTGNISGIVVLDLDSDDALRDVETRFGPLPETPTVLTGKGRHLYFAYPPSGLRNFAGKMPGVDLRGDGGYVVAPPSIHTNGKQYEWLIDPRVADFAPCPQWLIDLARQRSDDTGLRGDQPPLEELLAKGVPERQRNNAAARIAGSLIRKGHAPDQCLRVLRDWNLRNRPPLDDDEIVRVIESIQETHDRNHAADRLIENINDLPPEERHRSITAGQRPVIAPQRLNALPTSEFLSQPVEPIKPILGSFLKSQGLVFVWADVGVGKTVLLMSVALAIAGGSDLLRWRCHEQRGVVYVDPELAAGELQERIQLLEAGLGADGTHVDAVRWLNRETMLGSSNSPFQLNLADPAHQKLIEACLEPRDVLILDSASICYSVPGVSANHEEFWAPMQDWLLALRAAGHSVVVSWHANKSGGHSGTQAKLRIMDTAMQLCEPKGHRADDGAEFTVRYAKFRSGAGKDAEEFSAKLVPADSGLVWTEPDTTEARHLKLARLLVKESRSQKDAADELGVDASWVTRHRDEAVRAAHDQGLIVGELPDEGKADLDPLRWSEPVD